MTGARCQVSGSGDAGAQGRRCGRPEASRMKGNFRVQFSWDDSNVSPLPDSQIPVVHLLHDSYLKPCCFERDNFAFGLQYMSFIQCNDKADDK